jgi:predicted NBD/HSP70 family sugar kinase
LQENISGTFQTPDIAYGKGLELKACVLNKELLTVSCEVNKTMRKADLTTLRGHNRSLLLRLIREMQPVSMANLAQLTGLQPSTVSRIMYALEKEELTAQAGYSEREAGGGRPSVQWVVNGRYAASVGLYLASNMVAAIAMDLNQNLLGTCVMPLSVHDQKSADTISVPMLRCLTTLTSPQTLGGRPLIGVGVASMGLVNQTRHTVRFFDLELNLKSMLSGHYGALIVENDANAAAWGAVNYGAIKGCKNAMVVYAHEGLGSALVLNGEIYRGAGGAAGEVAFRGWNLLPNPLDPGDENNDDSFSRGMCNIINLLNPEVCLLTGDLYHIGDQLVNNIQDMLGHMVNPIARNSQVVAAQCDPMSVARHMATIVFDEEVFHASELHRPENPGPIVSATANLLSRPGQGH